jgi:hypothetical protein
MSGKDIEIEVSSGGAGENLTIDGGKNDVSKIVKELVRLYRAKVVETEEARESYKVKNNPMAGSFGFVSKKAMDDNVKKVGGNKGVQAMIKKGKTVDQISKEFGMYPAAVKKMAKGQTLESVDEMVNPSLDNQMRKRFNQIIDSAEGLAKVLKNSKGMSQLLDKEIGGGAGKDWANMEKTVNQIIDKLEDHESDWVMHADYKG